ncbi:hypothetical protein Pmar_PMAR004877 [Perkinsus marinus ATCC 50983]|uniref:Uncharacterized protein n=1 Tax=Perkinsus marinus (strain ATCC 50983 / TXsc) TaxID=423536 RepID=C5LL95_PERM5|nr:hypothetical protein Pmar_PMAR004877 [Perkinsus marinus ATCC 50983]EER02512.1 hypothetical protein Pmar_PMAR004877 [Perkinsus marinus ATCC 50983]|eukprot:XP_002769794.1 hypothetical protein Pmar_PMAR004877 [Perkinsus marinus ATCC 50983]
MKAQGMTRDGPHGKIVVFAASLSINAGACFSIGLSRAGDSEEPPFPRGCMDLLSNVPAKAGGPQAGREYRYLHVGIDCDFVQENLEEEETAALLDELVNLRHTLDHIVRAGLIEITTASRVGAREIVDKIREVQLSVLSNWDMPASSHRAWHGLNLTL